MVGGAAGSGGVVRMRDKFYVAREADAALMREIDKEGSTTTIRAPRQTGKTSLLVRGMRYAREQGATAVLLDLQSLGTEQLSSLAVFLRELAELIAEELDLDLDAVDNIWRDARSPQRNIQYLMEKLVLPRFEDRPLLLAFDEAVNLTLGLPIVRTSVDHGTAFDIAGRNRAECGSMKAAIRTAVDLTRRRLHTAAPAAAEVNRAI